VEVNGNDSGEKYVSEETKMKISLAKKGTVPWNKGLKNCYSEETRAKMSAGQKGRVAWNKDKKGCVNNGGFKKGRKSVKYWLGKKRSEETKRKISESHKGKSSWNKGLNKLIDKRLNFYRPTQFKSQGKCDFKEILRHNLIYKEWVKTIFEKNNYICQKCGERGGKLNAHHIKPLSLIISENNITNLEEALHCNKLWDINNGITLCKSCHKKTETYLSRWAGRIYLASSWEI